jgi:hypothetical protein
MFKKHVLSAAAAMVVGAALSAPAAAQVSINGGVQARLGSISRSGDTAPKYDNTVTGVDGLWFLFFNATKDLKGGYNAGFSCNTVSTTVDGANGGFTPQALPVRHDWDGFFAGQDNYSQSQGGFSSYGNSLGDSNGPMCNDEVSGYLETPFGKFAAGHIMNPMRLLYDGFTVNPVYGNQRGYYVVADVRGNAFRYSNSFGPVNLEFQINTASDAKASSDNSSHDKAYTLVGTWEPISGTVFGLGAMDLSGDTNAKYVTAAKPVKHKAYGASAKTRLGPINVGYTFTTGNNEPEADFAGKFGQDFIKDTDHTVKVSYDMGTWSFQGFLSNDVFKASTGQYGGFYHDTRTGSTVPAFGQIKISRTNLDLWALYDMGKDVKTYLRVNTIQKKFTSPDQPLYSASMRSTKLEGGWFINF